MLPSINTQQRRELAYNEVLIGICADQDLSRLVVLDQPGPAAALDTGERSIKLGLKGRKVFIARLNRCLFLYVSLVPSIL
jgi:hypothetical protein